MKTGFRVLIAAAVLCLVTSMALAGGGGLSNNLHIAYYQWYRSVAHDGGWSHWEGNDHDPPDDVSSCFYPVLGAYSSMDKAAIEKQMEWIKRSGIGVALLDVWTIGGETEIPTMTSMDIAASKGIRCAFYLEPYHVGGEYRTINDVEAQIHYLYDTYGNHPAAYKISRPTQWGPSSAPRMVFYSFSSFANITEADWAAYMDRARNTAYDPFLIGQPGSPGTMTNCHWDGLTPYDGFSVDP
ncbi:MAG: hypothetical protein Q7N50_12325, partial [Armatimonadota bacterium]|nr:hypothetical protein [Armatimonadota bacterium]